MAPAAQRFVRLRVAHEEQTCGCPPLRECYHACTTTAATRAAVVAGGQIQGNTTSEVCSDRRDRDASRLITFLDASLCKADEDFERAQVMDRAGPRVSVAVVPGRVHGLTSVATQDAALDAIDAWAADTWT